MKAFLVGGAALGLAFTLNPPAALAVPRGRRWSRPPRPWPLPATPEDLGRVLEDLAGMVRGLGGQWRDRRGEGPAERPLITLMLNHRGELQLSQAQVDALERLRDEFGREAAQREADIRGAERDWPGSSPPSRSTWLASRPRCVGSSGRGRT